MNFLSGLHGSLATILLCALLFVDEAGVPMPFAPNEILLIVAGLLIASGSLAWFVIYPLAIAAILLGAFSGYSWAKVVGQEQLRALAIRLHAEKPYDRARARISEATVTHIAVSRCLPGIRVYVTLIAGASEVPLATFMRAAVPAAIVWTTVVMALGFVVGVPAARFFSDVEKLALSGAILVLFGILAYRAARIAPKDWQPRAPFAGMAPVHRVVMAIVVDVGVVVVVASGLAQIVFSAIQIRIPHFPEIVPRGWDFATLAVAVALFYLISLRRGGTGETAGERLFDVTYVHPRRRRRARSAPPPPAGGASAGGAEGAGDVSGHRSETARHSGR